MTTKKKRIHELAKELGVPAQDLVTRLQKLGFSEVKGPQSALDEFTLLSVQGRLEAYGLVAKPAAAEAAAPQTGDLIVKKKKKRTSVDSAPTAEEEPAPVEPPEPAPAVETATARTAPAPVEETRKPADKPRLEPARPEREIEQPATAAQHRGAPALEPSAAEALEPLPAETVEELPETVYSAAPADGGAAPEIAEEAPAAADESERDVIAPAARAAIPASPRGADADTGDGSRTATGPRTGVPKSTPEELVKPASQRRPGKVVGFVDLSKVQAQQRPQTQQRKLKSKDDVAPNVQPTFGNDRKRALVRGDHAQRGSLTASQLREKESSRFLRRRGAPTTGPGAARPGAAAERTQSAPTGLSPLANTEVTIDAPVTVKKLADALSVKANQILGYAMLELGLTVNINSVLEDAAAELLAEKFEVRLKVSQTLEAEQVMREKLVQARGQVDEASLERRPPTIAFLGHVDHGKTTLLDTIRDSRIAKGESGGITQHIGAYQVTTKSGHLITILDTPGHEAFTAMRARGAHAVDIVVLVVAADDGVMPSTIEAIAHAKAANVPIVVALNKSDKPEANPERVKQQLTKHDLLAEDYGGQVGMISVSATKNTGVDALLERVVDESELLELKSHNAGPASGVVLEAEVQEGKGRVAFLLVKEGTLSQGDVILAGEGYGKVRSIHDDRDRAIKTAGPSMPVEVSGLSELPGVGDQFHVVPSLEEARAVAEERARKNRMMSLAERRAVTTESLGQALSDQHKKTVNVVLKADVQGSLEALKGQIEGLTHPEVDVRLLHSALGTVTENDVNLAASSNAVVLAFHVAVNEKARAAADRTGVDIRPYEVIYEMLDDLRGMMEGTLAPEVSEQIIGHVEVRALFKSSKFGSVAGSHVVDGIVTRDSRVRVLRGKNVVFTGQIAGLRRVKDDVKEVREGFDCGVTLKDFDAYEVGDVIEAFKMVTTKRLLKI